MQSHTSAQPISAYKRPCIDRPPSASALKPKPKKLAMLRRASGGSPTARTAGGAFEPPPMRRTASSLEMLQTIRKVESPRKKDRRGSRRSSGLRKFGKAPGPKSDSSQDAEHRTPPAPTSAERDPKYSSMPKRRRRRSTIMDFLPRILRRNTVASMEDSAEAQGRLSYKGSFTMRRSSEALGIDRSNSVSSLASLPTSPRRNFGEWLKSSLFDSEDPRKRSMRLRRKQGFKDEATAADDADDADDADVETPRRPWTIHPGSAFRTYWSFLVFALVLYNAVVLPLDIAFTLPAAFDSLELVFDVMFIFDLGINARTGFYQRDGVLVFDERRILWHYATGWALIDVPASIPFELLLLGSASTKESNTDQFATITKMTKLLKASRLLRVGRLVRLLNRYVPNLASVGKIAGLLVAFVFTSHVMGCFFFFLCSIERSRDRASETWTYEKGIHPVFADKGILQRWMPSVFAAFLMIIGEDIGPRTSDEELFAIGAMLIGACLYAWLFSQIGILIAHLSRSRARLNAIVADADEHMHNLELPIDIQDRTHAYINEMWRLNRCLDRDEFFEVMSPPLRAEICLFLYGETVQSVPIFAECAPDFIVKLCLELRTSAYLPGDFIVREGEVGTEMFFVLKGKCDVRKRAMPKKVLATLKQGQYFGDIALLCQNLRRTAMVRAATFCDVAVLDATAFRALCVHFPADSEKIRGVTRKNLEKYGDARSAVIEALDAQEDTRRTVASKWKFAAKLAAKKDGPEKSPPAVAHGTTAGAAAVAFASVPGGRRGGSWKESRNRSWKDRGAGLKKKPSWRSRNAAANSEFINGPKTAIAAASQNARIYTRRPTFRASKHKTRPKPPCICTPSAGQRL